MSDLNETKEINDLKDEVQEIKDNLLLKKNLESKTIIPLNIDLTLPLLSPRMLIFGGTSVIGTGLIKKFYEKYKIYVYSRDNNKQAILQTKFPNISSIIGDVRDYDSVFRSISFIFPTVIILNFSLNAEENPNEMIKTNINGVSNVINAIIDNPVYLHSSIDKTLIYFNNCSNMFKSIAEKIIINSQIDDLSTLKFVSLRMGNIIETKDSIINKCHMIGKTLSKSSFVLNSPHSTLFLDKLEVYINLVDDIITNGRHKHIYIPFLKTYTFKSIIKQFSKQYNKPIVIMGLSCNEQLHESLINETEALRTIKNNNHYMILPIREKFKDSPLFHSNLDLLRISKCVCPELVNGYNSDENNIDINWLI